MSKFGMTDEDVAALDALMLKAIHTGGPMAAVKDYRSFTGSGLRESAGYIAGVARRNGISLPPTFDAV